MFKKVLSTTVLGVSALGVMAANAAAPGVYVTGQLGYANTHMGSKTNIADINKKIPASSVVTPNDADDKDLGNNGLAGRIALGYQFNQNFAVEAGYLGLSQRKVDGVAYEGTNKLGAMKLQQNVIDLLAKGIVPICDKFNLYGKAGLAYINTDMKATVQTIPAATRTGLNDAANVARHKLAPEVALGASYDITPNVSVDTSWTHIQAVGKNRTGNIDFVAVGLGYNFG